MAEPDQVKELCEFMTQRRVIELTYTSLAPGVFVVEGIQICIFLVWMAQKLKHAEKKQCWSIVIRV